jgi:hypothetical protein
MPLVGTSCCCVSSLLVDTGQIRFVYLLIILAVILMNVKLPHSPKISVRRPSDESLALFAV